MSAELLSPLEGGGTPSAEPPTVAAPPRESPSAESPTGPASDASAPRDPEDLRGLVPPELVDALAPDSVAPAPPEPPPLDPTLFSEWTTYEDAVARSRETGRAVLLAFTAVGCETCETLRQAVFEDEAAGITVRSAVIPVALHDAFAGMGDEARFMADLQKRFDVTTFPTLVVWSPVTKRLRTLKGYRGVAATLRFITDAANVVD